MDRNKHNAILKTIKGHQRNMLFYMNMYFFGFQGNIFQPICRYDAV